MKPVCSALVCVSAVFLSGCWVSTNPFYQAGSAHAVERLAGTYREPDGDAVYHVATTDSPGVYALTVVEKSVRSDYTAVAFVIGKRWFIDISAMNVPEPPLDPAGPTASSIMKRVTAKGRHLALRFEISDTDLTLFMARPSDLERLFAVEPKLKRTIPEEHLTVITETTDVLSRLLASHGQDDSYFSGRTVLSRKSGNKGPTGSTGSQQAR